MLVHDYHYLRGILEDFLIMVYHLQNKKQMITILTKTKKVVTNEGFWRINAE